MGLTLNPFDPAAYRWVAPAVDVVAHVAVDASPVGALYAVGGAINSATGGKTKTLDAYAALTQGAAVGTRYSTPTQALSGYQGSVPNQGQWGIPIVNPASAKVVGQTVQVLVREVVAPVGNEASKALFGVSLKTLLWGAAGVATGLGVVAVATRR